MATMEEAQAIYQYLAAWRVRSGLSQEQVANILDVHKSTVSRWEKGERQMDLSDLQRLAYIYGVDPVALLMAPDDIDLAKQMTVAKRILQGAPDRMRDVWLETGTLMRGLPDKPWNMRRRE